LRRRGFAGCALAIAALAPGDAALAAQHGPICDVSITEPTLGGALGALFRQCGTRSLYPSGLAGTRVSQPVHGRLGIPEIMGSLLRGTHLESRITDGGIVTISSRAEKGDANMEPKTKRALLGGASIIMSLLWGAEGARAQEANNAATSSPVELQEVVVTAQKREQRLIDVPISITAVSQAAAERAGLTDLRDLQHVTPGLLNVNNGLAFQPAIRGVTSTGTSAGEESNVSLYVDDVYMPAQFAGLFELQNIDHIEVLKGPQGTLYGRNSTGGAIRVVTLDPSFDFQAKARVQYGFHQHERLLSAYVTGPLTDQLAASLTGVYDKDRGYVRNVNPTWTQGRLASKEYWNLRGKLLWKPTDDFRFVLSAGSYNSKNNAAYTLAPQNNQLVYRSLPGVVLPTKPWEVSYSMMPRLNSQGNSLSGVATFDLKSATLKSISAFQSDKIDVASDSDRTNLALASFRNIGSKSKAYSQEFDLSSNGKDKLEWIVGAFFFHSEAGSGNYIYAGDITDAARLSSGYFGQVDTTSFAGFGDLTYHVTDQLSVTGGARYTAERKSFSYRDLYRPAGIRVATDNHTWSNASYRANVSYRPTDRSNLYLSYSTGFKSGVYNSSAYPVNLVNPEEIKAWEIGYKAEVGTWLTLSTAAYRYSYDNIQLQAFDPTPTVFTITLTNAAKARVEGVEFNANARLSQFFDANLGMSWMPTAKYTSFPNAQVYVPLATGGNRAVFPVDISGSRMIRAPKFTLNGGLAFNHDLAEGEFQAAVNAAYNSGFYWQPGETARQKGYTLLNANLSWRTPDKRYKFTLFGENLTDRPFGIYQAQTAIGDSIALGAPREIGVRADVQF